MIINYIKLNNYRQFLGENTINFSVDPTKKATLVLAPNGTGKSTVMDAFRWTFYDKTDLKTIVNAQISKNLDHAEKELVSCEVSLVHNDINYKITRRANIYKKSQNGNAVLSDSQSSVQFLDLDGETKIIRGNLEVYKFINEIIPEDLFSYFFFDGENIEKIGKEISDHKASQNSEFNKAIRALLGFNWLYQEQKDLKKLQSEYGEEIAQNSQDEKYADLQKKINNCNDNIEHYNSNLSNLNNNKEEIAAQLEAIRKEIASSNIDEVETNQKESIKLQRKIIDTKNNLDTAKKVIFQNFSQNSFKYFSQDLVKQALNFLEENDEVGEGIPGMNIEAIQYFLNQHKCLCGKSFSDNDETYKIIKQKENFVLPNNFSGEISAFKALCEEKLEQSDDFYQRYNENRQNLSTINELLGKYINDKSSIDEKIKNYPDMKKKKETEDSYSKQYDNIVATIGKTTNQLEHEKQLLDKLNKEKSDYKITDANNKKLKEYEYQVNQLLRRIENTCTKLENKKRSELEEAINQIFSEIFNLDIHIKLDDDYTMHFESDNQVELSDFEGSTSANAVIAFAFIGGIIRLARNKAVDLSSNDEEDTEIDEGDLEVEPYPLFMDAPSSSFDISRIENFCKIMPNIAEQVVFFIKDTDGLYVKENLKDIIGKEYSLKSDNTYQTLIEEVI